MTPMRFSQPVQPTGFCPWVPAAEAARRNEELQRSNSIHLASDPVAVEHYAYQLFLQAADESARPARSAQGGACTARSATTEGMHAMAGRPLRANKNSLARSRSEAEIPPVLPALSEVEGSGVEGPVPPVPSVAEGSGAEGSEVEGRRLREATVQDSSGHGGTCPERSRGSRAEKSVGRRPATEGVRGKPDRVPPVSASNSGGIPLAYQLWLAHLLWLEEVLHTLDCRPGDVTAAELAGLQALSRARARFLQEHQFCSRCQVANPRFAQRCRRCAQEF